MNQKATFTGYTITGMPIYRGPEYWLGPTHAHNIPYVKYDDQVTDSAIVIFALTYPYGEIATFHYVLRQPEQTPTKFIDYIAPVMEELHDVYRNVQTISDALRRLALQGYTLSSTSTGLARDVAWYVGVPME